MREIKEACGEKSTKICTDFYGYELPWLCHSVAQKLDKEIEDTRVEALAQTGLLLELGLPTESAAKVFLAGVRSRAAAVELGRFVTNPSTSVRNIRAALLNPETVQSLPPKLSPSYLEWLHMLSAGDESATDNRPSFPSFSLEAPEGVNLIHSRKLDGDDTAFLCSTDGRFVFEAESTEDLPFHDFANDPRFVFVRADDLWRLECRDPRIRDEIW